MTRDDYVSVIKDAFITLVTKGATAATIALWPVGFANPFMSGAIQRIWQFVVTFIANLGETMAFLWYVDIRVSEQGRAFFEDAKNNQETKLNPGSTKEERLHAETKLIDSARSFIKLRG